MSDHVERFYAAVSVLAGHGNIKQRLTRAFDEHLSLIDDEELPIAIKQSFADLRVSMSRVAPLNGEGRIRATVRKMSIPEADECATKMIDLYSEIIRCQDNLAEALPLKAGKRAKVPPFLVKSV